VTLQGQTAIVTGGAQGIGRGIAVALAAEGADVAIFDTNGTAAHEVAEAIESATAAVLKQWRRLDVLVNNVGCTANERFADSAPAAWRKVVDVNFVGTLNCTHTALRTMVPAKRGRIVSIASDAARIGTPREAVYAGAKAAVIGFSKSLAAEVAQHGITVNVVSPATVDTPLLREMLTTEQIERRRAANPMGRLGTADDVAAAVVFFASPQAAYVTGQVLSVNGGVVRVG
jgi:2-hydroxycyclohexanecarboxyl-CoA dehydrogenase